MRFDTDTSIFDLQVRQVRKERNALIATLRQLERENDARIATARRGVLRPSATSSPARPHAPETDIHQHGRSSAEVGASLPETDTLSHGCASPTVSTSRISEERASSSKNVLGESTGGHSGRVLSEAPSAQNFHRADIGGSPLSLEGTPQRSGGLLSARMAAISAQDEAGDGASSPAGNGSSVFFHTPVRDGSGVGRRLDGSGVVRRLDRLAATVDNLLMD